MFDNAYSLGTLTSVSMSGGSRGVYARRLLFTRVIKTNRWRFLRMDDPSQFTDLSARSYRCKNVSLSAYLSCATWTLAPRRREFVGERVPICMLRDSKNPVATGR